MLLKDGPTPATANLDVDVDASGSAWLPEDDFLGHFAPDVPAVKARVMCAAQQPLAYSAFGEVMGGRVQPRRDGVPPDEVIDLIETALKGVKL